MGMTLTEVLDAVQGRVSHLRAITDPSPGDDWLACDAISPADLDAAIGPATDQVRDRAISASLLAQSYAHRVTSVSLASYAIGCPWPSPDAHATSIRLAGGRARALCFRGETLGGPGDTAGLIDAVFTRHLLGFTATVRQAQRLGQRLIWANVASSCASAFRAIEGAARDRGDTAEQRRARQAGAEFMRRAPWLEGTGGFEEDSGDWRWQRTACCLWYLTSGGRTCDNCSLPKTRKHP